MGGRGKERKEGGGKGPPLPHGFTLEIVLDVSPNETGKPTRLCRRLDHECIVICNMY